jgi:phage baseplate assembly protein W
MTNSIKLKSNRAERKNISIRAVEVKLGKRIMAVRNRGSNFSRLVCDLIHEAAARELGSASQPALGPSSQNPASIACTESPIE